MRVSALQLFLAATASLLSVPAQGQVSPPRRLRFKVQGTDKLSVSWKEPKGNFESYRFIYNTEPGGRVNDFQVSKEEGKVVIDDFDPNKEYSFKVIAVSGSLESKPLHGKYKAQDEQPSKQKDTSVTEDDNDIAGVDLFMCKIPVKADIVILVDGSWSIGRLNFRMVRMFLENLVNAFSVDFEQTRIGLAQYSGDPRIEWHLNTHTNKGAVIDAVKNLPYKGGNTHTGLALNFILQNSFKPESGSRPGIPKIGILITDGRSQDDVQPAAQSLRDAGVEMFAIGVKNADENELKAIASPPEETHVYNVADFSDMSGIVEGLTRNVCDRIGKLHKDITGETDSETPTPPRNLVISEVTARSFRVTWAHASGAVEKYRVVYYTAKVSKPEGCVVVNGNVNTVVLHHLNSVMEYQVAVFAVYSNSASEALRGTATTLALPTVNNLELFDKTHSSMRARWVRAEGATGYMILYAPLTNGEAADEKEVKVAETVTEIELEGLTPATEYTVTVYAIYGDEASDPLTSQETTLPLTPPRNLRITDVDHSSAKLTWTATSQKVNGYRIMYVKTDGVQTNEMDVGRITTMHLRNLTSLTEYTVAIFAIFDEGQSQPLTDSFSTKTVPEPKNLRTRDVTTDSFRASWQHAAPDVVLYKITWTPTSGAGEVEEVMVEGKVSTYVLTGLEPLTEYEVSLSAIYRDQAESKSLVTLETTVARTTTVTTTKTTTPVIRVAVRNMQLSDQTTFSMKVSWELQDPKVRQYRVSYITTQGDRAEEVAMVSGQQKSTVLQPLLSDTEYKITVTPIYASGDGPSLSRYGRTCLDQFPFDQGPGPPSRLGPGSLLRMKPKLQLPAAWPSANLQASRAIQTRAIVLKRLFRVRG
ncbi:collagen alpha-1(XIV) chain-like [Denticeps clupeoides]|uniref:collagen alpha-1(XIV) chain-like n=1 Tax=Denticeps clupeoides TaxID=299321 RepID=UPI0010A581D9|nr:collagen alpha-1(XIV) chain-like [Denticeps clupeoides]